MSIELKEVSFKYGSELVLDHISFSIKKGDYVGILGPNGSGKTTLMKIILGLLTPSKGKVIIKKEHIGYVPQRASFVDSMFPVTAYDVVAMQEPNREKIESALKKVSMYEDRFKRFQTLSGGQQQRVLIARALSKNPDVLILDEPTVGVDEKRQHEFYELLHTINAHGVTLLFVSHDISIISKYANKVACLNNHLSFFGTVKEFQKQETLFGKDNILLTHNHCCHD